ncbi:MAG: LTA synthase family protein [Ruminococcaceae bacterium]|nr:LTA synthase family protein [Oscillospiraceae bacterium]
MNDMQRMRRPMPKAKRAEPKPAPSAVFFSRYGRVLLFCFIYWVYAIAFRLYTAADYFFSGLGMTLLFSACAAIFTQAVSNAFKTKKARDLVGGIFIMLHIVVYLSQMVYYTIFKQFYSVYSAGNAGQVMEFWRDILDGIFRCLGWFLLFFALFALYVLYCRRFERKLPKRKRDRFRIEKLLAAVAIELLITCFLVPCARDPGSQYALFFGQEDLYTSYHTVGAMKSLELDFLRLILPQASSSQALDSTPSQLPEAPKDTQSAPITKPQASTGSQEDTTEVLPVVYGDNVMEIDFAALAQGESDAAVKQLHNYFASIQPTKKNSYTGIYEGYNLIWLTAEGFHKAALHPEITPTLYMMANNGYKFENFYNASWPTSTTDGEYAVCTSLIPRSGVWSFKESADNLMSFCLGNQLQKLGYKTTAYHNHNYDFYSRDKSHPNMGYTYWGRDLKGNYQYNIKDKLVEYWLWPESDHEMLQGTLSDYISDQPFHTYYMTVSGHLQYTWVGNSMSARHKAEVSHLQYSEPCLAYLACHIELENAMKYLLEELRKAGIADKTLIVISGDHYPYGLDSDDGGHAYIEELLGYKLDNEYEVMHSSLIMYVDGMEPVTVTKPCSSLDVLPTISNLMGIEYDSRLLAGQDIFSDSPGLVIFQDRSFITEAGLYKYKEKKFEANTGYTVDENYISSVSNVIKGKIEASKKILDLDYYRKIFTK